MSAVSRWTQTGRPRNKFEAKLRASNASGKSTIETWGKGLVVLIVVVWAAGFFIGYQASLSILTLVGFIAAILAWSKPSIALFGMGMLAAMDPMTRVYLFTGGLLRWNTFNFWMMAVLLLSIPFILRLRDPHSRLFQAFTILLALELLFSPQISTGIQDILSILTLFAMVVYFARALKEEESIYWLGIVIGVLAAAGDLIFYLQKDSLAYINPNAKAIFPVTALYAIALAFPHARKFHRGPFFLLLLAAVNALWIFLSGSRGNMAVGFLCLVFLFFMTRSLSWRTVFVTISVLAGIYLSWTFVDQQTYALDRLERLFDPQYSLESRTSGRNVLAQVGWQIFLEHPLGVGTGGFRTYSGEMAVLDYEGRPAHSGWVKILAENGIPGILLLAAYVLSFAVVGIRKGNRDQLLIGLMTTLVISSAFLSTEFQNKGVLFLAAGVTVFLHPEDFLLNVQIGGKLTRKYQWSLRNGRKWDRVSSEKRSF